jgi:alpha-L-rhamnosidase
MKPHPVGDLRHVRARHLSPHGEIASEWRQEGKTFDWLITVPVNTTATAYVPATGPSAVLVNGKTVTRAPGVKFLRLEKDRAVFTLGSGQYHFTTR